MLYVRELDPVSQQLQSEDRFYQQETLCSYPKSFEWFVKLHSDYKVTAKQDRYTDKQQMVINVPLLDPCEN